MLNPRHRRGFTLIEVVIAGVILFTVIGIALSTFVRSNTTVGESLAMTDAATRANNLVTLLSRELNGAKIVLLGGDTVSSTSAFTRVQFRRTQPVDFGSGLGVEGYDYANNTANYGPLHELRFVYDPGEGGAGSGNDVDDDRDGLIDEGQIELWVDTNNNPSAFEARVAVLAKNVACNQEIYPTDTNPGGTPAGARGIHLTFQSLPNKLADPSADDELSIQFSILTRLPGRGSIHSEERYLTIPYRNK